MIGPAPVRLRVSSGPHLVRVSIDQDWFPFEDTIEVQEHESVSVNANLRRSAWSFFRAGLEAYQQGQADAARQAFHDSLDAPGKQDPANWFYLGMLDEKAGFWGPATDEYTRYLNFHDPSVAAHYHLGLVEQAEGQTARAATSYKLALFRLNPQFETWTQAAPPATAAALQQLSGATDLEHRVQLAYLQELKGNLEAARDLYRALLEEQGADLDQPLPEPPQEDIP
jgi:hypothetical protein